MGGWQVETQPCVRRTPVPATWQVLHDYLLRSLLGNMEEHATQGNISTALYQTDASASVDLGVPRSLGPHHPSSLLFCNNWNSCPEPLPPGSHPSFLSGPPAFRHRPLPSTLHTTASCIFLLTNLLNVGSWFGCWHRKGISRKTGEIQVESVNSHVPMLISWC